VSDRTTISRRLAKTGHPTLSHSVEIDTKSSAADRSSDTAKTITTILADSITDHHSQSLFFDGDSEGTGDGLDGLVADVTTIAQSQCEHCEDYADIETLVSRLSIAQYTFAAHNALAPYSGPYPMAILVRAFLIENHMIELPSGDLSTIYPLRVRYKYRGFLIEIKPIISAS
jgi:hypothetical protein